ncbi:MAG: 3'-5' exonuclease [Cephaloticoccus sp.]
MATTWTEQRIHFVDFEGSIASGIVEYGVVELRGGEIAALHTRRCRPTGRLRREDVAVHGLDETALAGAAPLADDFARFASWRESGPLAAHFAGAENSLLKSVWPYPRQAPDFARPGQSSTDWGPWIDTGALYRQARPGLAAYGLAELVAACGLQDAVDAAAAELCPAERRRFHAAPYDALAGAVLLRALAAAPAWAELSVGQLLALSTLDGGKRDALQQRGLFD